MDAPLTRSRCFSRLFTLALLLGLVSAVHAQNFSFEYNTSVNSNLVPVVSGSTIAAAPTAVGASSTVTLLVINGTNANWTISNASATGAAFALAQNPVGTVDVSGAQVALSVTFAPATAGNLTGGLSLTLLNGSQSQVFNFFLAGVGQQPDFITSYILQPTGNQVAIATGGTLSFPSTMTSVPPPPPHLSFPIAGRGRASSIPSTSPAARSPSPA